MQILLAALLASFQLSGVPLNLTVPETELPYSSSTVCTLACGGLTDVYGVRVFSLGGTLYQHPVGQAQLALNLLNSYRLNGSAVYLRRAVANAQRLVDTRVEEAGAWFYPYPFDFAVYGDASLLLQAPWFSGLAQSQALSVFVRLFGVTGDPRWKAAADATFASLLVEPTADRPWVTWVDAAGFLWLEEYPRWPVERSERVLNGSIFAAFGVYDYLRLTGDPVAASLVDGQVTTVAHYFDEWRVPGHPASYSLTHPVQNTHYHSTVVAEFRCLAKLTGRQIERSFAWQLYQDYPTARRVLCGTI